MQAVREHIELEDWESAIFDKLLATCEHHGLKTVLRCAGGWVRDKLLSRPSHDIDIALDDCTGSVFAARVNEYLASQVRGLEGLRRNGASEQARRCWNRPSLLRHTPGLPLPASQSFPWTP